MSSEGVVQLVIAQLDEVQAEQPDLELVLECTGKLIVRGDVRFAIDHCGGTYRDSYSVEIVIPSDYPASPPTSKETGGAVPIDFHHFPISGNLCLATPVELARVFSRDRTLRHYINQLLIPYLFAYTHFRENGRLPHGQFSHGADGLQEYYQEFFAVEPGAAMKLLKLLADNFSSPTMECPCGRGRRLQDCHGPKLDELRVLLPPERFERDLLEMISVALAAGIKLPERDVMSKRMLRKRKKQRRREARRR